MVRLDRAAAQVEDFRRRLRSVEVDGRAPGRGVTLGEVGAELGEVVALGAEVVVDHVEDQLEAVLMAGVDQVLGSGWVDPKRLYVTGGSYGGFMTNWIVGHTDRFRAAATQRSISNNISAFGTSDIGWHFWGFEMGDATPWRDPRKLVDHSPLAYVTDVKTPLLLWGPYLWADGTTGRKSDGLVWERQDLAGDGTHPSQSGRKKVADMLLKFFKTDTTTKPWFVRRSE